MGELEEAEIAGNFSVHPSEQRNVLGEGQDGISNLRLI